MSISDPWTNSKDIVSDMASPDPSRPTHYHDRDGSGIHTHHSTRAILGVQGYRAYLIGCALKYISRWDRKNGVEDVRKARQCLAMLIEDIETDDPIGPIGTI